MKRLWAIAINTSREAIRDRVLYSLLFFAGLVLAASLVASEVTVGDQDKVVRGLALSSIRLFSSVIAIFLGVGLVWKELERRTIYTIASKPIPRWLFVLGKYTGLLLTLAVNVGLMLALFVVLLWAQQGPPHLSLVPFTGLLFLYLMLLTAWATLFSCYSSPTLATAFTLAIFVIGNLADDIRLFGERAHSEWVRQLSSFLYWVLPNFELFNVEPQATHRIVVGWDYVLPAAAYGLAYTAVVLLVAALIFERRDFR